MIVRREEKTKKERLGKQRRRRTEGGETKGKGTEERTRERTREK